MCLLENSDCSFGHMFTTKAKQELGVPELREQDWKPILEAPESDSSFGAAFDSR